nr:hypothetical protein [Acinetobacter sp. Marseille-Q1620]
MKLLKTTFLASCIFACAPLYAQTTPPVKTPPPYGDNPNIFRVLGYKAGQTVKRVGDATERGISKLTSKTKDTAQDAKVYASEQAELAKDNTVKKWNETRDKVVGVNGGTVPIEQGQLSQSAPPPASTEIPSVSTAPITTQPPVTQEAPINSVSLPNPQSTVTNSSQEAPASAPSQLAPTIKTSQQNPVGGADDETDYPH